MIERDDGNIVECQSHGMSLAEIEEVLNGEPRVAPDLEHSATEARPLAVGRTGAGRAAFVVFTMRGTHIRPLSARFMQAEEAARYGP